MIGERLKKARMALGLNQVEFSKKIDLRPNYISKYEREESQMKIETLEKISKVFQINMNWLLTGNGEIFLSQNENNKIVKKISGDNNNVAINQSNINSNNNFNKNIKEVDIKSIIDGIRNIDDTSILEHLDNEIRALISKIKLNKKYGESLGI